MRHILLAYAAFKCATALGLFLLARRADRAPVSRRRLNRKAKKLRESLSEKQIDKMPADSFPASDPPSTY